MSNASPQIKKLRQQVTRVLRFMNQYGLREFEFDDKNNSESIKISRSEAEASPPLLEGRSSSVPGQLRAITIGKLKWICEEGQKVSAGEKVAEIIKNEETVEIAAPNSGTLVELVDTENVQYGEKIGRIEIGTEGEEDEDE